MKHSIIFLFLIGSLFSAYAQNDTLNNIPPVRDTTPVTNNSVNNNNSMRNDSTGSVNNSMRNDSTGAINNTMRNDSTNMNNTMRNDSTNMNNTMRNDSTIMNNGTTNNNNMRSDSTGSSSNTNQMNSANTNPAIANASSSMITNSQNVKGQPGYATLPVLESYVPDDVVSKAKSKYPSVYDIIAVKHTADQTAYVVRYGDNGVYKTETIGEDGNTVQ
jgi:hypothetical protein